ncbi:leucine rich adaptor protein 1-like [Takifugu rubripes]|uniref:Leucine rich adaptor protein 1-like n=1 Tax=Takifugu rubripes TaxID=31033 RepID=A0A674PLZ4_TAKRU|nr:leucine rich adaptor protein 1-like [Takifugu rubripes]
MVGWRAFGNTAPGRPRSVEDLWGFGFPTQAGGVVELIIAKVGKATRFDAQEISHIMDEEVVNDSFPYLKELENKIGRKMPESLLVWTRDAAECEDFGRSGEGSELSSGLGDSFSERISTLKQEMIWLRSADVRILQQLVAVHEGIEAMRWLMEERDALVSRSSSLTGSLSSVVGHGPPTSPFREDLSHNPGLTDEDSRDFQLPTDSVDSNFATQSEARPHHLVTPSSASSGPANCSFSDTFPQSEPAYSNHTPLRGIRSGGDTIKRALLRSSRRRAELNVDNVFSLHKPPDEMKRDEESQDSTTTNSDTLEMNEAVLLGYDAQWCWVESQDDVTFL